jgi:hypothetical protein
MTGERLDRLRQALKVARHQARVAQDGGYGRHVEDALAHSGDRERPIRSIMNTDSGDHEHPLALA